MNLNNIKIELLIKLLNFINFINIDISFTIDTVFILWILNFFIYTYYVKIK